MDVLPGIIIDKFEKEIKLGLLFAAIPTRGCLRVTVFSK
jgi:hypothetical protein